jgi:hypothetical protein
MLAGECVECEGDEVQQPRLPESARLMRAGLRMMFVAGAMLVGAITGAAVGVPVISFIFGALLVAAAVTAFVLASKGADKSKAEQAEMIARTEARLGRKLPDPPKKKGWREPFSG